MSQKRFFQLPRFAANSSYVSFGRVRCLLVALVAAAFAWPAPALARELKYKDHVFDLRDGDRITISGVKGSVRLVPGKKPLLPAGAALASAATPIAGIEAGKSAGNAVLRVRKSINDKVEKSAEVFEQWTYAVRRDESTVRIEPKGPEAKADWEAQIKKGLPELHFELEAPAVPVEVALREGSVQAQGWKQGISVHLVEGSARFVKNEGTLRLQVQRGEIRVDGHRGRLECDGFDAKTKLSALEGDLRLDNFAGDSHIDELKGNLQLRAYSGMTSAKSVDGGVDFELGRASLNVQGLDGSLRGQLDNGSVIAKLNGDPEVNIEAQEGSVTLDVDPQAAATVRLQTESGSIQAPDELPASNTTTQKLVSGRLKGGGKGSVFVKTKTGNVRLR